MTLALVALLVIAVLYAAVLTSAGARLEPSRSRVHEAASLLRCLACFGALGPVVGYFAFSLVVLDRGAIGTLPELGEALRRSLRFAPFGLLYAFSWAIIPALAAGSAFWVWRRQWPRAGSKRTVSSLAGGVAGAMACIAMIFAMQPTLATVSTPSVWAGWVLPGAIAGAACAAIMARLRSIATEAT